jgi:hypothetical protein
MEGNIVFLITTFNRPDSCRKLVDSISAYGDIYILDDGSSEVYNIDSGLLKEHRIFFIRQGHGGKQSYWKTVNTLFNRVPKKYKYYFMIPDDFLPVDNMVEKTIKTWGEITDQDKICLTTYVSEGRLGKRNWTSFDSVEYDSYRKTQWVDMCFMCDRRFFDVVGIIPRIDYNWRDYPEKSSGVGSYISRLLHKKGLSMYQTKTSLFIPQKEAFDSKMNAWRTDNLINTPVL